MTDSQLMTASQATTEPQVKVRPQFGIRAMLYVTAFCAVAFALTRASPRLAILALGVAVYEVTIVLMVGMFVAAVMASVEGLNRNWDEMRRERRKLKNSSAMLAIVIALVGAVLLVL